MGFREAYPVVHFFDKLVRTICEKGKGGRYRSLMENDYWACIKDLDWFANEDVFDLLMAMFEARIEMLQNLKKKYPEHAVIIDRAIEHLKRVKALLKEKFPIKWSEFEPYEKEKIKDWCEQYEWHPEEWEEYMPGHWKRWWPLENYPWRRPSRWY